MQAMQADLKVRLYGAAGYRAAGYRAARYRATRYGASAAPARRAWRASPADTRDRDTSSGPSRSDGGIPGCRSSTSCHRARSGRPPSTARPASRRRHRFPFGVPLTNLMTLIQTTSCLLIAAVAALATGCSGEPKPAASTAAPATPPGWSVTVEPLEIPAPANTSAPQLTSSNKGVLLSWLEQNDADFALKFAERTATGWSAAQKVASSKDWFVSAADVPTVLRLSDGTLVANWYPAVDFRLQAYDIRLPYSKDEGHT